MAAVLSSEMDGAERDKFFVEHIEDCRRMGIEVLPPNINEGQLTFQVASEGKIHFGLGAIKGVGFKAVEAIIKAREEKGPVQEPRRLLRAGLDQGGRRRLRRDVDPRRRVRLPGGEAVAAPGHPAAGAPGRPGQARRPPPRPARALRRLRGARADVPRPTAMATATRTPCMSLPDVPEFSDAEKLASEKKALGFYMSSHPLARHAAELQALATHRVADLAGRAREGRGHPRRHDRQRSASGTSRRAGPD